MQYFPYQQKFDLLQVLYVRAPRVMVASPLLRKCRIFLAIQHSRLSCIVNHHDFSLFLSRHLGDGARLEARFSLVSSTRPFRTC